MIEKFTKITAFLKANLKNFEGGATIFLLFPLSLPYPVLPPLKKLFHLFHFFYFFFKHCKLV